MPWTWAPRANAQFGPHLLAQSHCAPLSVPAGPARSWGRQEVPGMVTLIRSSKTRHGTSLVGAAPPDSERAQGQELSQQVVACCLLPQTHSSSRTGGMSDPPLGSQPCVQLVLNKCLLPLLAQPFWPGLRNAGRLQWKASVPERQALRPRQRWAGRGREKCSTCPTPTPGRGNSPALCLASRCSPGPSPSPLSSSAQRKDPFKDIDPSTKGWGAGREGEREKGKKKERELTKPE